VLALDIDGSLRSHSRVQLSAHRGQAIGRPDRRAGEAGRTERVLGRFDLAATGRPPSMRIYTRRNALVGWFVIRATRRKVRKRLGRAGNGRRRGMLAGAGLAAAAATVAVYVRRGNGEQGDAPG
jgi:hypothetical protein